MAMRRKTGSDEKNSAEEYESQICNEDDEEEEYNLREKPGGVVQLLPPVNRRMKVVLAQSVASTNNH